MRPIRTADDEELTRQRRSGWRTIRRVSPYLWPKEPELAWVRGRVIWSMVILVLAKLITVATPAFYKWAVDALNPQTPVEYLGLGAVGLTVAYGMARMLSNGFQQLRDAVFAAVGQRALRMLALETFQHIHRLSMRYHLTRKTGGLSRIIERGVKGVDFLLRFLLFSLGPLVLELVMVAAIFFFLFDARYLAVIVITIAIYVWFTFKVTEWRVKLRREMNDQDTDANQKAIDSLLNFETVKYFSAERREAARYDVAMARYEKAALMTSYSLAFLNFGQAFLITLGLILVMIMAAIGVQQGLLTVGDFVMVNAYMIQITMPLNFLGTVYREIRQALVDMGEMFDLLEQPAEVVDRESAQPLAVKGGRVTMEDVTFAYDAARPILKGVSLAVEPGQTLAIVGPSGSGKSTIGRLLFRFYDVTGGAMRIDGQDLRDVTQVSLHESIGVVPQDTVLFNDTVAYNIGYGRTGSTQEEIETAAKAE
ncbi:MAG TPA: metal ABC transporter permease, partial [Rhodobacteraceae bacterium]|nr:metal ABC transporter permease [Paracoccaceae bacterium]